MKRDGLILMAGTALLFGCSSYSGSGLVPGQANEDAVRAAMGQPSADYRDGGHHFLEYARGPIGFHTYLASFDATGRLERIDQILTPDRFARIQVNTSTQADVRRIIGSPGMITRFARTGVEYWDYRYLEDRIKMRLYVGFDASGTVVKLERMQDPDELGVTGSPGSM